MASFRRYIKLFIVGLILVTTLNWFNYLKSIAENSSRSDTAFSRIRKWSAFRRINEAFYFELELKLKFVYENFEQRVDFVAYRIKELRNFQSGQRTWNDLLDDFDMSKNAEARHRNLRIKALMEMLFETNKYKEERLKKIAQSFQDKLKRQQNRKCRLDGLVYCSLEQNCGFGCHLHTMSMSLLVAYYWERTLIFAKKEVSGMEDYESIFLPIASNCRLHDKSNATIEKEAFYPAKFNLQVWNSYNLFKQFASDLSQLSMYHRDPIGFISGQIMSYVMRFNKSSNFYKTLKEAETRFNLTHPYVGVHIRRSDKGDEAQFFQASDYMRNVDEFFETYFIKHPEKANTTQPTIYLASDDQNIFEQIKKEYPKYRFVYNSSLTNYSGSFKTRYSKQGFESLIFDLYFLSKADHLVCTFTSSICRISYEFLVARVPDNYKLAKSLDIHFNNYDLRLYQLAIMDNYDSNLGFKRGDVIEKFVYNGHSFDGYHLDGWSSGKLLDTNRGGSYASYKAKDFYHLARPIASPPSPFSLFY